MDPATIVPDDSLTIDEGAVAPWQSLMWSLMKDIARDMGVRTDVPWRDLTRRERDIVLHAPPEKRHVVYQMKTGESGEMDFTFFNAFYTVENALKNVKDEKGMKRVAKFLREGPCPDCGGTRLSEKARAPLLRGISLDKAAAMTLAEAEEWVRGVPASLPAPMRPMAERICESFHDTSRRLLELGLSYLALDRAASTLSTGERQRVQLARAVRNRTTGVLYVLDEPSIGLHPSNLEGLTGVMDDLVADGNSVSRTRTGSSSSAPAPAHAEGPWSPKARRCSLRRIRSRSSGPSCTQRRNLTQRAQRTQSFLRRIAPAARSGWRPPPSTP